MLRAARQFAVRLGGWRTEKQAQEAERVGLTCWRMAFCSWERLPGCPGRGSCTKGKREERRAMGQRQGQLDVAGGESAVLTAVIGGSQSGWRRVKLIVDVVSLEFPNRRLLFLPHIVAYSC